MTDKRRAYVSNLTICLTVYDARVSSFLTLHKISFVTHQYGGDSTQRRVLETGSGVDTRSQTDGQRNITFISGVLNFAL